MVSVFTIAVATLDNHMLIRTQIEVAGGVDREVALHDQTAIHWVIGNQLAHRCCHGVARSHKHLKGQLDPLEQVQKLNLR